MSKLLGIHSDLEESKKSFTEKVISGSRPEVKKEASHVDIRFHM